MNHGLIKALGASIALYSSILWLYCAIQTDLYPAYQTSPISAYILIPQNLIADVAFPVGFTGFVVYMYERYRGHNLNISED